MKLSIIIPVLNEAQALPGLFEHLLPLARHGCEIIMVDGGSVDATPTLVACAGFRLIQATRGRASQMNAGAAIASGDALLFLHADTRLPDGACGLVPRALANPDKCWGRFDVCISGHSFMLRVVACLINLRSRLTAIATGDQALFMTRAAFDLVGGFPDQPLMEDVELCTRLRRLSRPVCITRRAVTSGRRWERHGVWRTIVLMWRLRWDYWRGVPAQLLARRYQ